MTTPFAIPTVADVLRLIGKDGVIVGSWPYKRAMAKDIDLVIKPRGLEHGRNPVFQRMLERFGSCERGGTVDSSAPGHMFIYALEQNVELFEDKGFSPDDPAKKANMVGYHKARRGAIMIDCYGIDMPAFMQAVS